VRVRDDHNLRGTEPKDTLLDKTLLQYLKQEWRLPSLDYVHPPTQILGGYETSIYHFQLNTPPPDIPNTLILRLFPQHASPRKAHWEAIVQNALAALGIPVPRVVLTCTTPSILSGEFNIMEYVLGQPMIDAQQDDLPELLGRAHARLHEVDPVSIMKQLANHGFSAERFSFQGRLTGMQKRIAEAGYDWLIPGLQWLHENTPEFTRSVICHGDFHPLNILMHKGKITGVLDWSGFRLADPAYDVASTKVVLSVLAPVLRPGLLSPDFMERYLAAYQTKHHLDKNTIAYFEVARLILGLVDGADGQAALRHKDIITHIRHSLREYTGLTINIPKYS
jgi:aminoglycoside phosphotransferase (APT) family kinase protein